MPNSSAFSFSTARSNRRRPLAVISTSVARASVGWDTRRHRPAVSRRSIGVGHGPRRDPQAVADRAERQRTGPSQHPEHLVAGERQSERAQDRGRPVEEDLLGPHDRDDRGHARRRVAPALLDPALSRGFDGVVDERVGHRVNLPRRTAVRPGACRGRGRSRRGRGARPARRRRRPSPRSTSSVCSPSNGAGSRWNRSGPRENRIGSGAVPGRAR